MCLKVVDTPRHEVVSILPTIRLKTWILLSSSTLAWALLFASLWYLALWKPLLKGPSERPPAGAQGTWLLSDQKTTGALWVILPMGLKEPMYGIRNIDLLEASPDPFTYRIDQSQFTARLNPEPYLKKEDKIRIVRITFASERPQVKLLVIQNFLAFVSERTPTEARPTFSVLQMVTEKNFGLFDIDQQENTLFCFMISDNKPVDFYTDVRPQGSINLTVSLDRIGFLLVGAGIPYHY